MLLHLDQQTPILRDILLTLNGITNRPCQDIRRRVPFDKIVLCPTVQSINRQLVVGQ